MLAGRTSKASSMKGAKAMSRYIENEQHRDHIGKEVEVQYYGIGGENRAELEQEFQRLIANVYNEKKSRNGGRPPKNCLIHNKISLNYGDGKPTPEEQKRLISEHMKAQKAIHGKIGMHYDPVGQRWDIHFLMVNKGASGRSLSYETNRAGNRKIAMAVNNKLIKEFNHQRAIEKRPLLTTVEDLRAEKAHILGYKPLPERAAEIMNKRSLSPLKALEKAIFTGVVKEGWVLNRPGNKKGKVGREIKLEDNPLALIKRLEDSKPILITRPGKKPKRYEVPSLLTGIEWAHQRLVKSLQPKLSKEELGREIGINRVQGHQQGPKIDSGPKISV